MTDLLDRVQRSLAPGDGGAQTLHGVLVLQSSPTVLPLARRLKQEFGFDMLLDVTAIDWIGQPQRFEVVWHFYSTADHVRVRVKTRVAEVSPVVDSLVSLYNSARYAERECHEMYGIAFAGNDDLRPILLYEGFAGHPLRKDYPKQQEQPLVPYREGWQ
jgi:NADH-quinone oxidoreductase subunit C